MPTPSDYNYYTGPGYRPDYHKGDVCYPTNWDPTRHCWPHLFIAEYEPEYKDGRWYYCAADARDYRKATVEDAESVVKNAKDARDREQITLDIYEILAERVRREYRDAAFSATPPPPESTGNQ